MGQEGADVSSLPGGDQEVFTTSNSKFSTSPPGGSNIIADGHDGARALVRGVSCWVEIPATNRSQAAEPDAEERPHTYGFELFGSTSEEQAAASLPSDTGDPSSSLLLETTLGSIRNDFDCQRRDRETSYKTG